MTPGTTKLILACVAIVAAAGAAAYVLTDKQNAAPPAVPPAHTDAAPAAAPPATPEASLTFEPMVQSFSLVRDSAAYANAQRDAPQLYPLVSGTGLVSASRSSDGAWIIAMTQDGQAAYIPSADLGPYDAAHAPAQPEEVAPGTLKGPAHVTNTATLVIDGKTVPLAGLLGKMGMFATQLQAQIDAHAPVTCVPAGQAYSCTLADGTDLGQSALFAGQAETSPDASADYQAQEEMAHAARRGLWR